jgi:hypothetical protein
VFFPDWYPLTSCYRLNNFFRIGILFAVMLPIHAIFADRVWLVFMEVGLAWRVLAFFLDWYPLSSVTGSHDFLQIVRGWFSWGVGIGWWFSPHWYLLPSCYWFTQFFTDSC